MEFTPKKTTILLQDLTRKVDSIRPESAIQRAAKFLVAHSALQTDAIDRLYGTVPTQVLAFLCRNLYELNVVLRNVLVSTEEAEIWLSEHYLDEREALERLVEDRAGASTTTLKARITTIDQMIASNNWTGRTPRSMHKRAENAGLATDHRVMYKLISKFTHPTSWTVNGDWDEIQSHEYQKLMVIYAQRFALDSAERVRAQYGLTLLLGTGGNGDAL